MESIQLIKKDLNDLVGPITTKNLFNGYGIFKDGNIFAIYINDTVYVRAKDKLAILFKRIGGASFLAKEVPTTLSLNDYYRFPIKVTGNKEHYRLVLQLAIQQANYLHNQELAKKKNRIKELPNLSIRHERLLAKIGILNVIDFQTIGAVDSFVLLRKEGYHVNLGIFWEFVGAIHHCHKFALSKEIKIEALISLNKALEMEKMKPFDSLLLEDLRKGKADRMTFPFIY